jgi:hypothetical protein
MCEPKPSNMNHDCEFAVIACEECKMQHHRCKTCGSVDETRWHEFKRHYGVSDVLKEKYQLGKLTKDDFPGWGHFTVRNALAHQRGADSLNWE